MKKTIALLGIFLFLLPVSYELHGGTWKTEFEEICIHTMEAPSLSTERVRELMEESNRLMKTIEEMKDPQKKVYIFRLKKCRNFFQYILDIRAAKSSKKEESALGSE